MATIQSKTISADSSNGHHKFTLIVTEEDKVSVSDNHTKITWGLKLSPIHAGYDWDFSSSVPVTYSVNINGKVTTGNIMGYDGSSVVWIKQSEEDIEHNIDGSKVMSFSFTVSSISGSYLPGSASASGSMTLTKKARASSISCSTADIGSQATVTITKENSSFTHTITYEFGSLSGTIYSKTTWSSFKWIIPTAFYEQIPNNKSGTGTLTCTTYSGNNSLGSTTTTFKVTCNEALCKPTITPTIGCDDATYELTGNKDKFIKGYSGAIYKIGAVARNGATLKNQRIICGSENSTATSGALTPVESDTFTLRAYDSRGYLTEQSIKKTLINYFYPTCNVEVTAPTADGKMSFTISGNVFNGSFGAVNNQVTVSYTVKENNATYLSWRTVSRTLNGNTYKATVNLTGLNYLNTYTIQANVKDSISNYVYSVEHKVKTTPIFDWSEEDFNFNVPVAIQGNTIADFVIDEGVSGNWSYRKWNSGKAECWALVKPNITTPNNYSGFYYTDTLTESFPFTFKSAPVLLADGGNSNFISFARAFGQTTQEARYLIAALINVTTSTAASVNLYALGSWK